MKHTLILFALTLGLSGTLFADEAGFETIFNGKDLTDWDGREGFWTVKDGHIRGETTPENKAPGNTFLIWKGGQLKDFELKLKYRILTGNNSGVQYRSKVIRPWVVSGYQAEVENRLGKTGFLYHEGGRGWLVDVGDFMEIDKAGKKAVVGIASDLETLNKVPYHVDKDWNEYHFVARGNHVLHHLNGYQTVELIDYHVDAKNPKSNVQRCMEGVLALQIHGGGPMTVDFKDIRIKQLTESFGEARRLFNGKDLTGWEGEKKVWSVVPLDDGAKNKHQTKLETTLNMLKCTGRTYEKIKLSADPGQDYIFRYQQKVAGASHTGGIETFKPVNGWDTHELTVRGGKFLTYKKNGEMLNTPEGAASVSLPGQEEAEYRNLVLIPIHEKKEAK